jgi:plasmid maintenance system antidote protein VapI
MTMFKNRMRPAHPGEVLREDYLVPLGLSASALAKALARQAHQARNRAGVGGVTGEQFQ